MSRSQWGRALGLFLLALSTTFFACQKPPVSKPLVPEASPQPTATLPNQTVAEQPTPQVSIDRLMGHMAALNSERFTERDRQRTRDYLTQVLQNDGWVVTEQTFNTGVNLVAQRPDTKPNAGKILVGAHYDSIKGSPGADDNASGVAAALEVATLLGQRSSPRNLQIVLFDQEEAGLVGSYAYAEKAQNIENVDGVVILEMLGYACHTVGCQKPAPGLSIALPSDVGDFVAVVGDAEHKPLLEAFQEPNPNLPKTVTVPVPVKGILSPILLLSDHTPFWYKNVGAVMVTNTAFLRNPHYHRRSDLPSTLDRTFFRGSTQIVVDTTAALLDGRTSLKTPR
ncbi:MAG: M28 family peptidase [Thermosynechococcaceae cyanobacterium]